MTDQTINNDLPVEKVKREWFSPLTLKKIRRFRAIRRGYVSFLILSGLLLFSLFAELFINNRALLVKYEGQLYFPTYSDVYIGTKFGLDYQYETNYRDLQAKFKAEGGDNFVILPLVPWNAYEQDFVEGSYPPYPPSAEREHYLGTDAIGRDILARLVYGFRVAMTFAITTVAVSMTIGVIFGCMMGFYGGWVDLVGQRLIEIMTVVPFLYIIMVVANVLQPSIWVLAFIYITFGWMASTWYMRSMTYKERARDYVMAAKSIGVSNRRIIISHILPNTMVMIVTLVPFMMVAAIGTLTSLDYLGFGVKPPTPSLGELLKQGKAHLDSPWIVASAIIATTLILVLVQFIGEAIREAFDPKRYTKYE